MGCPFSSRTPPLSPEDAQCPWAEEVLDSNFLGSGEELDLLSEILDSLSVQTKSMGSLRPSQSLDCCHGGDLDSCFSLVRGPPTPSPNLSPTARPACHLSLIRRSATCFLLPCPTQPDIPGRTRWRPDEETLPEPQPLSLPADLSSLHNTPSLEIARSSKNPNSQLPSGANQEIISPESSTAPTDTSSQGDPGCSPVTEPSGLHLSPLQKAAEHPGARESPHTRLPTANTQPSPAKSPRLLAPVEPNCDTVRTPQFLESSLDPSVPENPRNQPPKVLLEQAHLQSPEEPGAPNTLTSPTSDWQEPQARKRPRVADLKKCFEG